MRLREDPVFCWVRLTDDGREAVDEDLKTRVHDGMLIVLGRVEIDNCQLKQPVSIAQRRNARPPKQPRIACGVARPKWEDLENGDTFKAWKAEIDTSSGSFASIPSYTARVRAEKPASQWKLLISGVDVTDPGRPVSRSASSCGRLRTVLFPTRSSGWASRLEDVSRTVVGLSEPEPIRDVDWILPVRARPPSRRNAGARFRPALGGRASPESRGNSRPAGPRGHRGGPRRDRLLQRPVREPRVADRRVHRRPSARALPGRARRERRTVPRTARPARPAASPRALRRGQRKPPDPDLRSGLRTAARDLGSNRCQPLAR